MKNNIAKRGLASLSLERRTEIARMGGQSSSSNFKFLSAKKLKEIARKGGMASHGGGRKVAEKNLAP